jgi:hypothetical protein
MLNRLLVAVVCLAAAAVAVPAAQSDLDALMARVLERRDENWKKLQQYTLNERQTLQITALVVFRLFGFERTYLWFPREGFFIRSPLEADGVTIGEAERRRAEDRWLRRSQRREQRRAEQDSDDATGTDRPGEVVFTGGVEDIIRQSFEPEFIESANFLKFTFDEGRYALVGRERMLDRDVLAIEYYPTLLFRDDDRERRDGQPRRREEDREDDREDEREDEINEQLNKVSLVTLWVDPAEHQILRYEFRNIDLDFLPIPSLVRIDGMRATMQMSEPFPDVWLPASISMRFRMTLAAGPVEGRYELRYSDYRLPTTSGRIVQ